MALVWAPKDPDAVKDYGLDWSAWLKGDTITQSAWFYPAGVTVGSMSFSDTQTFIWLSGGTVSPSPLSFTNRISTAAGRTEDRTVRLRIMET